LTVASTLIAGVADLGKLKITAAVYDLASAISIEGAAPRAGSILLNALGST
jgi:hypothetical protein